MGVTSGGISTSRMRMAKSGGGPAVSAKEMYWLNSRLSFRWRCLRKKSFSSGSEGMLRLASSWRMALRSG